MAKVRKKRRTLRKTNKIWQVQEAKARFSQLIQEVENGSHYTITKNGHPVAVVMSTSEFEKMKRFDDSLLDFFKQAPFPDIDLDVNRSKETGRDVDL
jgi:prevent-host-death family protein